jgi:hypothetical protein
VLHRFSGETANMKQSPAVHKKLRRDQMLFVLSV